MVPTCGDFNNLLVSECIDHSRRRHWLGLLVDAKLAETRLSACEDSVASRIKEDTVLMTGCNLVNSDFVLRLDCDLLWAAEVYAVNAKLTLAIVAPGVDVVKACLGISCNTDCMFATACDIEHLHVSQCVNERRLGALLDRDGPASRIILGFWVLVADSQLARHVIAHHEQHVGLGDQSCVIVPT